MMKRSRDEKFPEKTEESPFSLRVPPKRPKSSQACSSCRRHKTRCELLEAVHQNSSRCHRCQVLNIACSFDNADFSPVTSTSVQNPDCTLTDQRRHTSLKPREETPLPSAASSEDTAGPSRARSVLPQDIVPAPVSPWGYLKAPGGFDWTANPMLAIQELARRSHPAESAAESDINISLVGILTHDQTKYLLEMFEVRYSPWLNLPESRESNTPLLDLARCTIACRHLDPVTRSIVAPRLQQLTEDVIFSQVFNPLPSTELIHSLLILSLWSPVCALSRSGARDGRLLVASSVSMAMNLRLSQASVYALSLRDQRRKGKGWSTEKSIDLAEATDKAHLWIALTNVESMLCMATGRTPLSQRTASDHGVLDMTSFKTVDNGRDIRLGLMAQLFDLSEAGLRIKFVSYSEIDRWHKEVLSVLAKIDGIHRLIAPLHVVAEHDVFYFHTMMICYHATRLLILHHAIRDLQRVVQDHFGADKPWYRLSTHNDIDIATVWGSESIRTAEAVLVTTLSRPDLMLLGTAPDIIFAFISYAAAFLVMARFAIYQNTGQKTTGFSDSLMAKTIECFSKAAYAPDHTPANCAQLLTLLGDTFESRVSAASEHQSEREGRSVDMAMSAERYTMKNDEPPPSVVPTHAKYTAPDIPGANLEYTRFINSDIFLDNDFWASFMDNLSTNGTEL